MAGGIITMWNSDYGDNWYGMMYVGAKSVKMEERKCIMF